MSGRTADEWLPGVRPANVDCRFTCPECPNCRDTHERDHYRRSREGTATVLTCPACGVAFRPQDEGTVHADLSAGLARHRHGEFAAVMARALRRYEGGTREFLGVAEGAERALYANADAGVVYAVAFDRHGVSTVDATLSRGVHDPGAWVDRRGTDLLWTHPRYGRQGDE